MFRLIKQWISLLLIILPFLTFGQFVEPVDSATIAAIKNEGFENSEVMNILSMLTDVHGPRLSFSPGYIAAATYAKESLTNWGLENAHFDSWGDMGRGWHIKKFDLDLVAPVYSPLIAYPKAWSPGLKKPVTADVVYVKAATEEDLTKYKGKLKGKIVMLDDPATISIGWEPDASRFTDSELLKFANDENARGSRYRPASDNLTFKKWQFLMAEGVAAVISPSPGRGDNGAMLVSGVYLPISPDVPWDKRVRIISPEAPATLPQVALMSEHYNRLFRLMETGATVRLELNLNVEFLPATEGFNVIAEIPGTDLKDEVVMIGAHLDSWHSGTGATDNGAGSAVCMEAMRIIKSLGKAPRRTIRIGLWGGEEQGLLGSRGYVRKHLGETVKGKVTYQPEAGKFSAYFNMDNGTGKFRGVYLQENDAVRNIFKAWMEPFHEMDMATLTLSNTGGTDHLSFDGIGLPGFQFIQDPIEYRTRTHHTNLDSYDKAIEADLKQNSVIMASFAWLAANREEMMPRKYVMPEQ